MDEVEFQRAYNNLRVLIDDTKANVHVSVTNALLTIAAMLDSLSQRINELAEGQGEDED